MQRFSKTNLKPLDSDITLLLEIWFQDGFLYLEEITYDFSYRQIELIKNSDLIHPMTRIEEMGQRLGKDRRCFALYHRLIPYEPIIFIEVALTRGVARNISKIIEMARNRTEKKDVDTAIFYAINNTQNRLTGFGLGRVLIGQVVDFLRKENDQIKTFTTLSPLPGFWRNYLMPLLEEKDEPFSLKHPDVQSFFSKRQLGRVLIGFGFQKEKTEHLNWALLSVLSDGGWVRNKKLKKILYNPLVKIAYHYISKEKNPGTNP